MEDITSWWILPCLSQTENPAFILYYRNAHHIPAMGKKQYKTLSPAPQEPEVLLERPRKV